MTLQVRVVVTWIYPGCVWPADIETSIAAFFLNIPDVWRPPIFHVNSAVDDPIFNKYEHPILIANDYHEDTRIIAIQETITFLSSSCKSFSFKNFPFDQLSCNFIFDVDITADYFTFEYVSIAVDSSISEIVDPADVWHFVGFDTSMKNVSFLDGLFGDKNRIFFTATFTRKYQYYILNILLPVWLLFALQISILILPPDLPERPSYSVTVVLAYAVSLTFVLEKIPQTTEIVYLIVLLDLHIVFSVVMTIYLFIISYLAFVNKEKNLRTFDVTFGISTFILVLLKDFSLIFAMVFNL